MSNRASKSIKRFSGRKIFNAAKLPADVSVLTAVAAVTQLSLRDEFTKLHGEATSLVEKSKTSGLELPEAEQTELNGKFARMDAIKKHEENVARLAGDQFAAGRAETPSEPEGRAERDEVEIVVGQSFDASKVDMKAFRKAMNLWAFTGKIDRKFATITTATANGAMLPKDVIDPLVPVAPNTFRQALAVWNMESMKTPTTREISLPVASATAGGKVSETASTETENEPSIGQIDLKPATFQSGTSWFSNLQLQAVDFDLFSEMLPALLYSKELAFENDSITTITTDSNITQNVPVATVTGFTYNNLVALNRKLPKRYQAMKVIMLSKDAYTAAEQLTTTTGYPILNVDAQNSELKRFNGTPVIFSDYLSTFGANNVIGFVMSLVGFRLRDCDTNQVQRYTQTSGRPAQTGFNLYGYHCIGYDAAAMALLKCPAS